ncbi:hypothetical protein VP01_416g1 [Puccinia sorghi]|uniref:Uncharacterized protein n=1 Tax=Puccinia sorghi TaxID=27349 RepID=A0A0L6UQX0_9BASI|nr:hypothetical protein VP01_416g1 [Puccinia sorghi]
MTKWIVEGLSDWDQSTWHSFLVSSSKLTRTLLQQLGSKSNPISLFTEEEKKCQKTAHNTKVTGHTEATCWILHPHLRPAEFQRKGSTKLESSVSSFHTSLSKSPVWNYSSGDIELGREIDNYN